jgi:hypothetical protein
VPYAEQQTKFAGKFIYKLPKFSKEEAVLCAKKEKLLQQDVTVILEFLMKF